MSTIQQWEGGRQRAVAGLIVAALLLALVFRYVFFVPVAEIIAICLSFLSLYLFWRLVVAVEKIARKM